MKIKLRVVGIYFGASPGVGQGTNSDSFSGTEGEVIVEVEAGATVADVMKKAFDDSASGKIPNVAAFTYTPAAPTPGQFIKEISIVYTKLPPVVSGTGGGPYVLRLTDTNQKSPAHELQYYHYRERENGDYVQLNKNNVTTTFADAPETPLEDGDSIVWRQVTILFEENGNRRDRMYAMAAAGKVKRKDNDKVMTAI